jgi:hypothetical protein
MRPTVPEGRRAGRRYGEGPGPPGASLPGENGDVGSARPHEDARLFRLRYAV